MYSHSRLVWLRLNADGILLALLALASGLDVLNPDLNDLAREVGYVPPTFYLWTTCYLAAGIAMLAGFIGRSIGLELLGRLLICCGFGIETVRHGTVFGWTHPDLITSYVVGGVLVVICVVRARVLLARQATHIVIGGRRRHE